MSKPDESKIVRATHMSNMQNCIMLFNFGALMAGCSSGHTKSYSVVLARFAGGLVKLKRGSEKLFTAGFFAALLPADATVDELPTL